MVALGEEELHGYAIMQEVKRRTSGKRRLAPGTLYRSLKQMEERGWVVEAEERPEPGLDDERRRYYRLTDLGRRIALRAWWTRRVLKASSRAHVPPRLGPEMRPRGGPPSPRRRGSAALILLLLATSGRLYGALLVLYPTAFRRRYGAQMRRDFHELSREGLEEGALPSC